MTDTMSRSQIRGTIYKMQDARRYLVQDMYQVPDTVYRVRGTCLQGTVPGTGIGTSSL